MGKSRTEVAHAKIRIRLNLKMTDDSINVRVPAVYFAGVRGTCPTCVFSVTTRAEASHVVPNSLKRFLMYYQLHERSQRLVTVHTMKYRGELERRNLTSHASFARIT